MRARRGLVVGWAAVLAYAGLLVVAAVTTPGHDRAGEPASSDTAAERFVEAWARSRAATFVTTGTFERRSEATGAVISSADVVAQRPPRRLHRQLGGVDGRDDDRLLVCPAPPEGDDRREPCRLGGPGGPTYEESVDREVRGLRSVVAGDDPLYAVAEAAPGCFTLDLQRPDLRAPFGLDARFCFDDATGAPLAREVHHEGGITETLVVTDVRTDVREDDLRP